MQLLMDGYRRIFPRLPYPVRVALNLCLMVVIVPATIVRIVVDHVRNPDTSMMFDPETLEAQLSFDVLDDAMEPLDQVADHCRALATAGRWAELSKMMASFDRRHATFGTARLVAVAGQGARGTQTDHINSFGDCAMVPINKIDMSELTRFETACTAHPEDPYLAGITARMHVELAWALRGGGYADEVSAAGWDGYHHHIARAQQIVAPFAGQALDNSYIALINTVIAPNLDEAETALPQSYAAYLAIDPYHWDVMGDYAFHLLPRWYGDYEQIEVAARKATARTEDTSGAAAYAAFYMGVLHCDDGAIWMVEPALFEQGLRDMIEFGGRDPVEVNHILAYCHDAFAQRFGVMGQSEPEEIIAKRKALQTIPKSLTRDYFTAHVPAVWDYPTKIVKQLVGSAFEEELLAGAQITFTSEGAQIQLPETEQKTP